MNCHKKDDMIGYPAIQKRITDDTEKTCSAKPESARGQRAV
jgi:hypothetical protein